MSVATILRFIAVLLFLGVIAAQGQSARRFETEQISPEQWRTYFDEVRALPSAKVFENSAPHQVLVQVPKEDTIYIFTAKTHPAHPAVVKREIVVERNGDVRFARTSYFAGERQPYEAWLREFDELERRNREAVQRRLERAKPK
jgi:hypothetical protein